MNDSTESNITSDSELTTASIDGDRQTQLTNDSLASFQDEGQLAEGTLKENKYRLF